MSTTGSPVSPSTINNDNSKFVIPHYVNDADPSKTAFKVGLARSEYQHNLNQVSKGKMSGGKNKNKRSKKHSRKSVMRKRFSKRFRRSILRRKSRKMNLHKKNKKGLRGGGIIIPSFRQASPTGTGIINQLAGNHAQTLAYSKYDSQVSTPPS